MFPVIAWRTFGIFPEYPVKEEFIPITALTGDLLDRQIGFPEDLSPFGLKREHFPFLIKNCRSGSMKTNPRPMSDGQAETLLAGLLGGQ